MIALVIRLFGVVAISSVVTAFAPGHPQRPSFLSTQRTAQTSSGDSFDMDDLRQRLAAVTNPYQNLFSRDETDARRPDTVHCIFFKGEQQGMHTVEYPAGSGSNVVLAFASAAACDKFAGQLRAQAFYDPTVRLLVVNIMSYTVCVCVCVHNVPAPRSTNTALQYLTLYHAFNCLQPQPVDLNSLEAFCQDLGVFVQVVPASIDLIPPFKSVAKLGHKNPAIRQQQIQLDRVFTMLESDEWEEEGVMVADFGGSSASCWE